MHPSPELLRAVTLRRPGEKHALLISADQASAAEGYAALVTSSSPADELNEHVHLVKTALLRVEAFFKLTRANVPFASPADKERLAAQVEESLGILQAEMGVLEMLYRGSK